MHSNSSGTPTIRGCLYRIGCNNPDHHRNRWRLVFVLIVALLLKIGSLQKTVNAVSNEVKMASAPAQALGQLWMA